MIDLDKLHTELDSLTNLDRDRATLLIQELKVRVMIEAVRELKKLNETLETGTIVVESP